MTMQPDDPRLTAFALGELDGNEHAEVAAAVAADPTLQATVDEIRQVAADITAALATEPVPNVEPIELNRPLAARVRSRIRPPARPRFFRFPYLTVGSLAAACFAVIVILLNQPEPEHPHSGRAVAITPTSEDHTPREPGTTADAASRPVFALDTPAPSVAEPREASEPAEPEAAELPASGSEQSHSNAPVLAARRTETRVKPVVPEPPPLVVAHPTPLPLAGDPNTTPVPVRQQPARPEDVAAGLATDRGIAATERTHLPPRLPEAVRRDAFEAERNRLNETALAVPPAGASVDSAPGAFRDLLAPDPGSPDYLRLTFREFGGPPRYQGNRPANANAHAPDGTGAARGPGSFTTPGRADNGFVPVGTTPVSTFPMTTGTASLPGVRRALSAGEHPPRDLVRIEELLQLFAFDPTPPSADGSEPFAAQLEVAQAPWAPDHRLVRVVLSARQPATPPKPGHVVVLVEAGTPTTPSPADRLDQIRGVVRALADTLTPADRIAIVVHSGAASLELPSTSAADEVAIVAAIERIRATGTPRGVLGLQLAYDVARAHFVPEGANRVLWLVDGDTTLTAPGTETAGLLIREQAAAGIALTALAFGAPDLRNARLEQLAQGAGAAFAFVDTARDALRALQLPAAQGSPQVAEDVKVQVEFNPAHAGAWRLIGYEDRAGPRPDSQPQPEGLSGTAVRAGQVVTALFEIVPVAHNEAPQAAEMDAAVDAELLTVKLRYRRPGEDAVSVEQFSLPDRITAFDEATPGFRHAAAVAGFGMILRDSPHRGTTTLDDVAAWARAALPVGFEPSHSEFLDLIGQARQILR